VLDIIYLTFLLLMFGQGLLSMYLSFYAWEDPERAKNFRSPKVFEKPKTSFSILLPARNEQAVIGETIRSIANSNYPRTLFEILLICHEDDVQTIIEAKKSIKNNNILNARVITFSDGPLSKPHNLNVGLKHAHGEAIVIFDAEDDVHPDILNIANTLWIQQRPDIIQAGVQLMNYSSQWFSSHNVLEYFFWFKSRMHFHTRVGMVPLGGNTVFFKTAQLRNVGGWDETCLTEDAEIGIRMSVGGAKIISTYDAEHVTREETPESISQFIKQRTRWNQGFLQVLALGYWKSYDSKFKRLFCLYTLSFPITQALLLILTPIVLIFGITAKLPIALSLVSFLPLLLVMMQYAANAAAMHELITEQRLVYKRGIYFRMLITFLPYQILLGYGALRATYRHITGKNNWEKTAHAGAHRTSAAEVHESNFAERMTSDAV
jgi:cellulose synthase/poly-beta-1,6-N-acetylglucosamine synthase-like glycosyltransferase